MADQKENQRRAGPEGRGPEGRPTRDGGERAPEAGGKQCCQFDDRETNGKEPISPGASDFSDPVYKEIAVTNGHINRMSKEELRAKLSEFKLETRGVKDVLKKRLKNYYKKQKLMQKEDSPTADYYDYICVIDFEATCEEGNPPEFIHEIIEFPIVLLNTHTLEIEDTFQQYVRPEINTQLSDFCINLTGITQWPLEQQSFLSSTQEGGLGAWDHIQRSSSHQDCPRPPSILSEGNVWNPVSAF